MPVDSVRAIGMPADSANRCEQAQVDNQHSRTSGFKRHKKAVAIHRIKKKHADSTIAIRTSADSATSIDVNKPKFTISNLISVDSYTNYRHVQAEVQSKQSWYEQVELHSQQSFHQHRYASCFEE
jgi:hypothetical protein